MKAQRVRRSPEEARAEILAAAQAALAETDFPALTVDGVMSRTGMTRSSFYHYFSGLDELALGLLEEFAQDIRASVDPWLQGDGGDDPVGATVRHLTEMFQVMRRHQTAVYAVAQAATGHPTVYREWQTRILDHFFDLTEQFIRRQLALGRSRAEDPARLAEALILMNNAVANEKMARQVDEDPETTARVLAGVWNAAIYGRTD